MTRGIRVIVGVSTLSFALLGLAAAMYFVTPVDRPARHAASMIDVGEKAEASVKHLRGALEQPIVVVRHSENMPCHVVAMSGHAALEVTLPPDRGWDIAMIAPSGAWLYFDRTRLPSGTILKLDHKTKLVTNGPRPDRPDYWRPLFLEHGDYVVVMSEVLDSDIEDIEYRAWCRVRFNGWKP